MVVEGGRNVSLVVAAEILFLNHKGLVDFGVAGDIGVGFGRLSLGDGVEDDENGEDGVC